MEAINTANNHNNPGEYVTVQATISLIMTINRNGCCNTVYLSLPTNSERFTACGYVVSGKLYM